MVRTAIRQRLLTLFPFLQRWFEVAPACCGVCSTCVTTTASTLLLPIVGATVAGKVAGDEPEASALAARTHPAELSA
jgi:hypothetical protein